MPPHNYDKGWRVGDYVRLVEIPGERARTAEVAKLAPVSVEHPAIATTIAKFKAENLRKVQNLPQKMVEIIETIEKESTEEDSCEARIMDLQKKFVEMQTSISRSITTTSGVPCNACLSKWNSFRPIMICANVRWKQKFRG